MKRIIKLFLIMSLLLMSVSGCSNNNTDNSNTVEKNIEIFTTIFPIYDWCRTLSDKADKVNISRLIASSTDMHSYQPTAQDIVKMSTCDVFIYVGGESDEWVDDALKQSVNKDMVVINLMDVLKERLVLEEEKQGMEAENNNEQEEEESDEHVWLSLKNAILACEKITDELCRKDPGNADIYRKNSEEYLNKLHALDERYADVISSSRQKTLLFADRFPFRYMCEDYGLDYFAAFKGCSAESEASFETIRFLSEKVDELGLKAILRIEGGNGKIAKTVVENTIEKNQEILIVNSLQSSLQESDTYLDIMENNLDMFEKALS